MHDPLFVYAMLGLTTLTLAVITLMSDNEKETMENNSMIGHGRISGGNSKKKRKTGKHKRKMAKHNISSKTNAAF